MMEFFWRYRNWSQLYRDRVIAVTLCQGAALHYLNGRNGVKDFDLWTFFEKTRERRSLIACYCKARLFLSATELLTTLAGVIRGGISQRSEWRYNGAR